MKYSLDQELLINNLIKEKIRDLHRLLHDKKNVISDRQQEKLERNLSSIKNYFIKTG